MKMQRRTPVVLLATQDAACARRHAACFLKVVEMRGRSAPDAPHRRAGASTQLGVDGPVAVAGARELRHLERRREVVPEAGLGDLEDLEGHPAELVQVLVAVL